MKTTLEVPEDLYRRVKAKSAIEGRTVKDVTIELYRHWLELPTGSAVAEEPAAYDALRDVCGVADSGVDDLASNPRHLEDFGT